MEKDAQDELDLLLGRIVALEEVMVGFIAAQADVYQGSQEEVLAGWLKSIKQGSQFAQRAVGERPDAVWEAAVQSLEALFARAAMRHAKRERS